MSYRFSDHFPPTALSSAIDSTQTTITVDTLTAEFVNDVQAGGEYPLRLGGGSRSTHERVLVTGIADAANNQLTVERGVEYGAESHAAGSRVAHAMPAGTAQEAVASPFQDAELAQQIQLLRAALNKLQLEWTKVVKSGTGSKSVFQLSHGLGAVPGLAQVQERSSEAAKEFYVSARTSSYVEITFASSPPSGTDNLTFGLLVGLVE